MYRVYCTKLPPQRLNCTHICCTKSAVLLRGWCTVSWGCATTWCVQSTPALSVGGFYAVYKLSTILRLRHKSAVHHKEARWGARPWYSTSVMFCWCTCVLIFQEILYFHHLLSSLYLRGKNRNYSQQKMISFYHRGSRIIATTSYCTLLINYINY